MKFVLDSSVIIALMNGREPELVNQFVGNQHDDYSVCSVIKAELMAGAAQSRHPEKAGARLRVFWQGMPSLPFDDLASEHFAEVATVLKKSGKPIGIKDLMIAATARAHGLSVITRNVREFQRVPNLKVEAW